MIPPTLQLCPKCGEYYGKVHARELANGKDEDFVWDISCACHGRPCEVCGRMAHPPGSNFYEPETNTAWHRFYLTWIMGVRCRRACKKSPENMK